MAGFRAAIDVSTKVDIVKWNTMPIEMAVRDDLSKRMLTGGMIIRDTIKAMINRGNPTGEYPSAPGEPPKKVSARLFNSITARLEIANNLIVVVVGSNVEYARRLELGFAGRDSAGRVYNQAPRPFMRPGLERALPIVKQRTGLSFRVD